MKNIILASILFSSFSAMASDLWKEKLTCYVKNTQEAAYVLDKVLGPNPLERDVWAINYLGVLEKRVPNNCTLENETLLCAWGKHWIKLGISQPRISRRFFSTTTYYGGTRTIIASGGAAGLTVDISCYLEE